MTSHPLFIYLSNVFIILCLISAGTARRMYHCGGWVAHGYVDAYQTTDLLGEAQWALCPTCGAWAALTLWEHIAHAPIASPSGKAALRELLESFAGITEFFRCYLVEKRGYLHSGPSTSPENSYILQSPQTADQSRAGGIAGAVPPSSTVAAQLRSQLQRQLQQPQQAAATRYVHLTMTPAIDASILRNVAEAYALAVQIDPSPNATHAALAQELAALVTRLPGAGEPVVRAKAGISEAKSGQEQSSLLEYPAPFGMLAGPTEGRVRENADAGHRHFSALHWLYPGPFLPGDSAAARRKVFQAAQEALQLKRRAGGGHTGWSAAWEACLQARLRDGSRLWDAMRRLQGRFMSPRLLGLHPRLQTTVPLCQTCYGEVTPKDPMTRWLSRPTRGMYTLDGSTFQLDANGGWLAAALEALVQSQVRGRLELLPALPPSWRARGGFAVGLHARGDVGVAVAWEPNAGMAAIMRWSSAHPWLPSNGGVVVIAPSELFFVRVTEILGAACASSKTVFADAEVGANKTALMINLQMYPCTVYACSTGLSKGVCDALLQRLEEEGD